METKTKYILGLLMVFILSANINAQIISGGIVGGVSTGAVRVQNVSNGFTNVVQGNNIYGFEAGVFAKLMLSPFYIKPMALYNFSTGDVKNNTETSNQTNNFTLNRFEVPLLFGLRIIGPLSIEAGPVYNYIIQSTTQYGDNNISIAQGTGIGYRIGAVAELGRLLLSVHYGGVTVNTNGLDNATFKEPYKIIFGLGLKFGKIGSKGKNKSNEKN